MPTRMLPMHLEHPENLADNTVGRLVELRREAVAALNAMYEEGASLHEVSEAAARMARMLPPTARTYRQLPVAYEPAEHLEHPEDRADGVRRLSQLRQEGTAALNALRATGASQHEVREAAARLYRMTPPTARAYRQIPFS